MPPGHFCQVTSACLVRTAFIALQAPLQYLFALQQRHTAAAGRVEARKRRRLGQAVQQQDAEGLEDPQRSSRRRRDEKHR